MITGRDDGKWVTGARSGPEVSQSLRMETVMKKRTIKPGCALMCGLIMLMAGLARPAWAQDAAADPMLRLYVDPTTHVVYTEPGRGRRLLATIPSSALSGNNNTLEQRQERTEQELQENRAQLSELAQKNQQLESQNENFQTQIAEIKPAWRSYVDNFQDKFRAWHVGLWRLPILFAYGFSAARIDSNQQPGTR